MVFNATFNNISVISWRSVLLVTETGVPEENHLLNSLVLCYHYIGVTFMTYDLCILFKNRQLSNY